MCIIPSLFTSYTIQRSGTDTVHDDDCYHDSYNSFLFPGIRREFLADPKIAG